MTAKPTVRTRNRTAWLSFANAMAVSPAAAAKIAHTKPMRRIVTEVVMASTFEMARRNRGYRNQ